MNAAVKRGMDVLGALIGLALLAPVFAAVASAIRLRDGSPVLYRQRRVGTRGTFELLKFRTMHVAAGASITAGADPRITRTGQRLRQWKLDELPQLVNVVRGEMSLVGPRPELPEFVAEYTADQREVLRYRPGMTDPASLQFRDEAGLLAAVPDPVAWYREVLLPEKLRLSIAYARRATPWSDLFVLAATIWALLGGGRPASFRPMPACSGSSSRPQEGAHAPMS
ncbi:MAG TPA: sugar transferase [Gemmatimonadales bacterium]|nr:sugar transferase [Gemmatimonadales bacterium]